MCYSPRNGATGAALINKDIEGAFGLSVPFLIVVIITKSETRFYFIKYNLVNYSNANSKGRKTIIDHFVLSLFLWDLLINLPGYEISVFVGLVFLITNHI